MPAMYKFRVLLRPKDGPDSEGETVEIEAYGRHLAARAAEAQNPGFEALAVATRWEVIGHCDKCRAVLFADERNGNGSAGPRCFDC